MLLPQGYRILGIPAARQRLKPAGCYAKRVQTRFGGDGNRLQPGLACQTRGFSPRRRSMR